MYQVTAVKNLFDNNQVSVVSSTSMEFDAGDTCDLDWLVLFCDLEMIDLIIT